VGVDFSSSFGLERLQREVLIALHASINPELEVQQAFWDPFDQEYAAIFNQRYDPLYIEPIPDENFLDGHRPSLIDAPAERFPNISVMAFNADPIGQGAGTDQSEEFNRQVYIEVMCKSSPAPSDVVGFEQEVNRRIQRTTDAVLKVFLGNRTLNRTAFPLGVTPTVSISEVFAGRLEKGVGERFLWQGGRIVMRSRKMTAWLS